MTGGRHSSDAVALRSLSFPRKRESRDFCGRKAGIGRGALDSWSPIGVGDELRGNDGGAVDSRFRGNDRWAAMAVGGDDGRAGMVEGGNDRWAGMVEGGNDRWEAMRKGRPFLRGAPPWFLGFLGVVFAGFSFCGPSGTLHRPPVWPLCPGSGLRWPVRHRRSYP